MAPKEAQNTLENCYFLCLEKCLENFVFCLQGYFASLVTLPFVDWKSYIHYKVFFFCRENPLTLAGEKGHVELVSLLLSRLAEACYYSKM